MKITYESLNDSLQIVRIAFSDGSILEFINIGAAITRWITADGTHIVAGYQNYRDYREAGMFLGTTVGLTAGRIKGGKCLIHGKSFAFRSRAKNFLHGGDHGLSFSTFALESVLEREEESVLTYKTDYLHEFMPGTVTVRVRYTVRPGYLKTEFLAESTEVALVNLTNHSYFNLEGDYAHDLSHHELRLRASEVVLVDDEVVGIGPVEVAGTPFDFRLPRSVMPAITDPVLQNQTAKGIDHFFVFDRTLPKPDIIFSSRKSRKTLEIDTSYPGVTIYSTNYPGPKTLATGGKAVLHSALAIEPQFQSNGINDSRFFNLILEPGILYRHSIEYRLIER